MITKDTTFTENKSTQKEAKKTSYDYSHLKLSELVKRFGNALKKENTSIIKAEISEIRYQFDKKFGAMLAEKKDAFLKAGGERIDFYYDSPIKKEFNKLVAQYLERREKETAQTLKQQRENLMKKEAIIKEVKVLVEEVDSKGAYNKLKALDEKWKSIGDVPHKYRRILYGDYRYHLNNFYKLSKWSQSLRVIEYERNLEKKQKLIQLVKDLSDEKDIQKAVRILKGLHVKWKKETGPVAPNKNEEIWQEFKDASSVIRDRHRIFLNEQKGDQEENKKHKETLLKQMETLDISVNKNGSDWKKMDDEMTALEKAYLEVGPAPKTANKELWTSFMKMKNRFKKARNQFFNQIKKEQKQNLIAKKELIEKIIEISSADDFDKQNETVKELQNQWKNIGNIPFKNLKEIREQFTTACDNYYNKLRRNSGIGAAQNKIRLLKQQKEKLEKEKKQLNNNIGFIVHLPKDNEMVVQIRKSITSIEEKLEKLNAKLLKFKKSIA